MSETDYTVNLRDLHFVLFEQVGTSALTKLPPFRDYSESDFKMVVDEAVRFAREVLAPVNRPSDEQGCTFSSGQVSVPGGIRSAWQAYREAGWICMNGGAEHGGQGLPTTVAIAAGEVFTGSCLSLALCSLLTQGVIHVLERFAPEEMQNIYLPKLFGGDWTGTMVLTEAQAGSDVGASKTRARKAASGSHYLIEGEKIFITCGDHDLAENIVHLVLARVEGAQAGTKGLSLFVVPKLRVGDDGSLGELNDVRCTGIEHKMGIHGSPTCTMSFGEDGDCRGYLLGDEGQGIRIMFHMMNEARIDCGVQGSALANTSFLNALSYAQQRVQGSTLADARNPEAPRVTIDKHPDVRRMLLTMKAYSEAMRGFLVSTARLIDISEHSENEEERAEARARLELLTPICKAHCSDMGFMVCNLAIQAYGGFGYLTDYPVEQALRDVRIASIYEGTNGIQAMDLLGRKLPMKGGKVFQGYLEEILTLTGALDDDPRLGEAARGLTRAVKALGGAARHLGALARENTDEAFLHASSLLSVMGDCALGYTLLQQAQIARARLTALLSDAPSQAAVAGSPEATFYAGKIDAARHFAATVLPPRTAEAEAIVNGNSAPLDVVFPELS